VARASWLIILYHAAFAALMAALFRWLHPPMLGQLLGYAVLLYVFLFPVMAWLTGHNEALDLWAFLLPLSLFQVMPDWILVKLLGVLVFPDLGGERIGGVVPVYMAGLWIAPLMMVVWLTSLVHRFSGALALLAAPVAAGVIFGLAEWAARPLAVWVARNVQMEQGVALYVLPAEMLLGLAAWLVYSAVEGRHWLAKIGGAFGVSVFYTGALVTSYFVVERLL
jgi:hypothetical protein